MKMLDPDLRQRGRASVEFLAQLGMAGIPLTKAVAEELDKQGLDEASLPDDLDERNTVIEAALAGNDAYAAKNLMGEWHARMHGPIAAEAFAQIEPELAPALEASKTGPATLELGMNEAPPKYWDGVSFHRTGTWDGHPYMGFVHGEIVHKKLVDRLYPGGIFKQRRAVAKMPPRDDYKRILEIGTSSGHFTVGLQEAYPDAQITGIDLSPRMLEHAQRVANVNGWNWKLYQRAGEDTGFADGSFDLVASFIVLHEMPADAIRDMFAEAFRVLESGGDMIMSDVTRYADLDKLAEWNADRIARMGGEPHWRSSASLDLAEVAREAGFVDVKAEGIYPHVVQGRKP